MSYRQHSSYCRIIAIFPPFLCCLVLCFSFTQPLWAKVTCEKQWGPASVYATRVGCMAKVGAVSDPSSFEVKNFNWNVHQENLSFELKLVNPQLLQGLKFTFYKKGVPAASYTLPLYTDPDYNILQNSLVTPLSIPRSNLIWTQPAESVHNFDKLTVYMATIAGGEEDMIFEILKVKTDPRKRKQGIISITFDDGYFSNFTAAKIMQPLGLTGTAYLIPEVLGEKRHLTPIQAKKMKAWGWSLGTHLATPVTEMNNLSQIAKEAKTAIEKLGDAEGAKHFALPLGKYNKSTLDLLQNEYASIRLAGGLYETLPVVDKSRLKTFNVIPSMSPQVVFEHCKKAIDNGDWIILMFHYLDMPSQGELNYSSEDYKKLMKLLVPLKDAVKTVPEALSL